MLSKALQINTTLRSVTWDRNNTSAAGFLDVARALEHNFTLQFMPLPLSDISQAYRSAPERTEQALTKIQRALVRNNQTQRFSQRQALRLHQGLVTSTAEQVMERLSVRVQQQVCLLRGVGEMEEIQAAKQVLKEARNSRALYPSLCEVAHVLSVDGPVRQKLDSLAGELSKAADKELQVIVDSMVSLCRELCPLSSSAADRLSPSLSSVSERVSIPRAAIRAALMERAAQDIHKALEEVKLSVVSYLTNSIVDQILQELYATHKALTRQVSHVKCWENPSEDGTAWRFNRQRDSLDITDEELSTSIDTIAIKKRSSRTRRIRPVSTRLSLCDDSSSSPPPSLPSYSSPISRSASWEGLSELPTQGLPLHHVTRVRPRPPRRHRGGFLFLSEQHGTENGGISPLDDGLPDFFTKRVLPDSQLSSLHKAHSLRRKKRRNMLAIFGFRKNRNQSPEFDSEVYGDGSHSVATAPTGTAMENVYTFLQPPRSAARAGSPNDGNGADGRPNEHQGKTPLIQSSPIGPNAPHSGTGGSKHPFYSPREVQSGRSMHIGDFTLLLTLFVVFWQRSEVDAVFEPAEDTDKYWVDDKQRTTEVLHTEKLWLMEQGERTFEEPRTTDRQVDKYRTESRQWTVDRHTQRQIDRKMERQCMGGRQIDRSWSENRSADLPTDSQWTESRHPGKKTDRSVQALYLAQRPLPPYPSERTPSPKQDTDPLKSIEVPPMERYTEQNSGAPKTLSFVTFPKELAMERNLPPPPVPPPVTKPIHGLLDRAASQGEEGLRPLAPVKPQRSRKSVSCDAGTDRESPNNVEKPPNRKPPVKKPRLPQNRNKSLEMSGPSVKFACFLLLIHLYSR
uniref:Capping protein, Arp2/3 and myosin-I linker protein 3-like n=1 Tax=Gouania willdenowi TaxID=441366 RepID=A0A8C5EUE9_GOUWI